MIMYIKYFKWITAWITITGLVIFTHRFLHLETFIKVDLPHSVKLVERKNTVPMIMI